MQKITLGGGCFWCIEAGLHGLQGVQSAVSGYMGGKRPNPSYEQVCTGVSGHIEVVEVCFDDRALSLETLLQAFFLLHDPTQINRQGGDIGEQYKSIIFYSNKQQKEICEQVMKEIQKEHKNPIATELKEAEIFYPAEDYHQNYYINNSSASYCQIIIAPKLKKLMENMGKK